MIDIRLATTADAHALAELRWEFRAGRAMPIEGRDTFIARCEAWMRQALDADWRAWIAVDGNRDHVHIVGHAWLCTIEKIPNPVGQRTRQAYISNVYVRPNARGGVGRRLVEHAMEWAAANDVDYALLTPTERSRTLYARHGFAATDDWLARKF
ncbi:MAG TPA: GNAT family N-acetyltransferase [Vicinamibacterales bacterium]|jgi:GNAT superfamily N-acetyltransferase|nr:GNAT family N-acetyltransferase [Vicinamibacterales bacterium]